VGGGYGLDSCVSGLSPVAGSYEYNNNLRIPKKADSLTS